MKLRKRAILLAGVFLLLAATIAFAAHYSLSFSKGVCLMTERGDCILLHNNAPIVLSNRTGRSDAFANLQTGDTLLVLHDGIAESYPARTGVYAVFSQRHNSAADIPQEVVNQLVQLGWSIQGITPSPRILSNQDFDTVLTWANYADDDLLYTTSLNFGRMYQDSIQHLPIWQISSSKELSEWTEAFNDILTLNQGYAEVPSFLSFTSEMTESFFSNHQVLLVYTPTNSCSYRYDINRIDLLDDMLCVHVQRSDDHTDGDTAMAGWLMIITLPSEIADSITIFDADLNNLHG